MVKVRKAGYRRNGGTDAILDAHKSARAAFCRLYSPQSERVSSLLPSVYNMSDFDKDKADILPEDGVILGETEVVFYEGETVFNLLRREMKKNGIHMEFNEVPMYESAYIEGINNIYEFDCGELSGWMYKVNDWFPNYGCSRYKLKEHDKVEWIYTCDLGRDIGGDYSQRNGKDNE